MLKLLRQAVGRHGRCRHFVSDRGAQFTGQPFREALAQLGIRQRFGAIGKTGSIALIERFWRTVKDGVGLRFWRPFLKRDLDSCVEATLVHYAYLRPHQGLRGGAPAEVYFRISPARRAASRPPRGRRGQESLHPGFEIVHLDRERRRLAFRIERAA
jgi:transposase InsO family protein